MIANLSDRQFVVHSECMNLRKGFAGLFQQVRNDYDTVNFFNNVGYVFINRRRNMLKCLYWENDGLAIWHKRLTKGTFGVSYTRLPADSSCDSSLLSFSDLLLFTHGFTPPENR
jgi:transposase